MLFRSLAQGTNDLSEAVPLLADLLWIPTGDRYPPLNTLLAQLAQVEALAHSQNLIHLRIRSFGDYRIS